MKNKTTWFLILALFTAVSCKKNDTKKSDTPAVAAAASGPKYDTLFPSSYLPVYPGSYWKYLSSTNDTNIYRTEPNYELDFYVDLSGKSTDTVYVPLYNKVPMWGYEQHTGGLKEVRRSMLGGTSFSSVLLEPFTLGKYWTPYYGYAGSEIRSKLRAIDTTVIINGRSYYPTLFVETYMAAPLAYLWSTRTYYTKDIGVIKEESFEGDSMTKSMQIVHYFINK